MSLRSFLEEMFDKVKVMKRRFDDHPQRKGINARPLYQPRNRINNKARHRRPTSFNKTSLKI